MQNSAPITESNPAYLKRPDSQGARVNGSSQLTLGLSLQDEARFDNFYAGANVEIVTQLQKAACGEGEKIIYLCGARSQGLSHLLQATCQKAHQYGYRSGYLPLSELKMLTPEILVGLESLSLLCIDDIDSIAGNRIWEEAIF